jgi:SAM-dependent methyltransferase
MPLAPAAAQRVYDRIGRIQDAQAFYEDPPTSRLAELGGFESARSVFELGCGTGRYAARLLAEWLPADARYLGVDVSPRMLRLAREHLRGCSPLAEVELLDPPALELPGADGAFDRFVATYVFDLLEAGYSERLLEEAHRLLAPTGRLCLVGLTDGATPGARRSAAVWTAVARWRPGLLGGCRPVRLRELVTADRWHVEHHETLTRWWITSEILVASPVRERGDGR